MQEPKRIINISSAPIYPIPKRAYVYKQRPKPAPTLPLDDWNSKPVSLSMPNK